MKKIFLIIPNLHRGGAEKFMTFLANNLDKNKFDVSLVLLEKKGSYLKELSDNVKIIDIGTKKVSKSFFSIIRLLNKEKPDIVFSTLGHLNLLMMMIKPFVNKKIKFIAREASIPSIYNKNDKKVFNLLYKILYPKFDKIVCQSNFMLKDLKINYQISPDKMVVIHNPVDIDKITKLKKEVPKDLDLNKKNVIAVGSLEPVKCYDKLIEYFLNIKDKNICLNIIGEGSLKQKMEVFIKNNNAEDKIKLLGFKRNPYQYMYHSDLFVIVSKFEGFPNAVLESIACGTPVLGFKCPGGIEDIIVENINGWYVKNRDFKKLINEIENKINHNLNEEKVIDSIRKFEITNVINKYEELFERL